MSVHRRALRTIAIVTLALPVVFAVYLIAAARAVLAAPRTFVVALLGAGVIGSVYAEEAARRAPAGVRRGLEALPAPHVSPLRAAIVMAVAVALLGAGAPATPTRAQEPGDAVVRAAKNYLGVPYRLGREGPNFIDCSGLVFRVFADIGELPRVSGKRLRAVGYYKWFRARGLTSKREAKRGDLVVFGSGRHIGIYLGDGRVLSAMIPRVRIHGLHDINEPFTTFLNVQWGVLDGTGGGKNNDGGKAKNDDTRRGGDTDGGNRGLTGAGSGDRPADDGKRGGNRNGNESNEPEPEARRANEAGAPLGFATGTMNLRAGPGPAERIIGWVSRGSRFSVLDRGNSPSGALWYRIEMANGKSGWVYSRWVDVVGD